MKIAEIEKIFSKLNRLGTKLKDFSGPGIRWKYTFDDGTVTKYSIKKIRELEGIQDDIENYFIWLWNLKDYFKSVSPNKKSIEEFVNLNNNLRIAADIANSLKHSELNKSRSGLLPKLGKLKIVIPDENFSRITFFKKDEVEIEPVEANQCELYLPIYDCDGNELIDSFELIKISENEWRKLFNKIKVV